MGEGLLFTTGTIAKSEGGHALSFVGLALYFALVLIIILATMAYAKKGLNTRIFYNPIAQLYEQLYLFIENMCVGIIGPKGRKYMPMILTFWLVIFVSNVVAVFMPAAPTADLSFNLAMALVAVGYVQYEGIRENGLLGHLRHFAGPSFGPGLFGVTLAILISPVIFTIEVISEIMKNVSLSLRLFGNIYGGHEAVAAMDKLGGGWVPFGAFLMPIKLLTCIVQAMIFTLLTCVYISLVTHHGEEHGEHGEEAAH